MRDRERRRQMERQTGKYNNPLSTSPRKISGYKL